jgi:hypothetical protein
LPKAHISSFVFTSFRGFYLKIKQEIGIFVYGNIAKIRRNLRKTDLNAKGKKLTVKGEKNKLQKYNIGFEVLPLAALTRIAL